MGNIKARHFLMFSALLIMQGCRNELSPQEYLVSLRKHLKARQSVIYSVKLV